LYRHLVKISDLGNKVLADILT